jgi:hypothetical protein
MNFRKIYESVALREGAMTINNRVHEYYKQETKEEFSGDHFKKWYKETFPGAKEVSYPSWIFEAFIIYAAFLDAGIRSGGIKNEEEEDREIEEAVNYLNQFPLIRKDMQDSKILSVYKWVKSGKNTLPREEYFGGEVPKRTTRSGAMVSKINSVDREDSLVREIAKTDRTKESVVKVVGDNPALPESEEEAQLFLKIIKEQIPILIESLKKHGLDNASIENIAKSSDLKDNIYIRALKKFPGRIEEFKKSKADEEARLKSIYDSIGFDD